jgi:hypothetical protein
MSALLHIADSKRTSRHVRFVPQTDIDQLIGGVFEGSSASL